MGQAAISVRVLPCESLTKRGHVLAKRERRAYRGRYRSVSFMLSRRAFLVFLLVFPLSSARGEPSYRGTYAGDCAKQAEASVTITCSLGLRR